MSDDRALEALRDRLREEAEQVTILERRLKAARERRSLLVRKLLRFGLSTREIGRLANMSSPGVSYINRRDER